MRFYTFLLISLFSLSAMAEVDPELRKQQWDQIRTEQYITTGASATVNAALEYNRRRLLKKGVEVTAANKEAQKIQKSAVKLDSKAKAKNKAVTGLSLKEANAELAKQGKAATRNKWSSRVNNISATLVGAYTVQSLFSNIALYGKGEEDCCTVTEVAGDPSDEVADDLTDLAEPIMYSYKKKQDGQGK